MADCSGVTWKMGKGRDLNTGLIDFRMEHYHCVKIEDEYLSRRRSDTPGVDNRYRFPQRASDGCDRKPQKDREDGIGR